MLAAFFKITLGRYNELRCWGMRDTGPGRVPNWRSQDQFCSGLRLLFFAIRQSYRGLSDETLTSE
jgi:hypothetical protein